MENVWGSIFWGLEFSRDLDSLGPRSGALFGSRAETENKKFRKKIEERSAGPPKARGRSICRFCHMVNPALEINLAYLQSTGFELTVHAEFAHRSGPNSACN
jgi:hypothetical protein